MVNCSNEKSLLQRKTIRHMPSHRTCMARLNHRDGSHLSLLPVIGGNLNHHNLPQVGRYLYVKEFHKITFSPFSHSGYRCHSSDS